MRVLAVLLVGLALTASASAGTGGYPDASARCRSTRVVAGACPKYAWGYRRSDGSWSLISRRGFDYRNCTDYVAWKLGLSWWSFHFTGRGDASHWLSRASHIGRRIVYAPHVGDIAWWPASADEPEGHVALVVRVGPGKTATVAEYNFDGRGRFDWRATQAPAYLHAG